MTNYYGGELAQTVSINGQPFVIDMSKYRSNGVKRLREGVVTSGETNDQLLSAEGGWWRYRYSWHLGAGQQIDELDPESSNFRFRDSFNMNIWDRYQLKAFAKATEGSAVATSTSDNPKIAEMVVTVDRIYARQGQWLYESSNGTTWSVVTVGGVELSNNVRHIWTDGVELFVHRNTTSSEVDIIALRWKSGIDHNSRAITDATSPDLPGSNVSAVSNNRFIAASNNKLYEIFADKTGVEFYSDVQALFRWTVIFSVGSRTYAGGFPRTGTSTTNVTQSKLFNIGVTTSGDLFVDNQATTFLPGEELLCAAPYAGNVIFGMSTGIRFAVVSGDGTFSYGPLISAPGRVRDIAIEGKYAWFTWNDMSFDGEKRSGVGRLSLEEFTSPLAPAYAKDVVSPEGTVPFGTRRHSLSVARFNNKTVFATLDNTYMVPDVGGIEFEKAQLESEEITFGTIERKSIMEVSMEYQASLNNSGDALEQTASLDVQAPYRVDFSFGAGNSIGNGVTTTERGPLVVSTLNDSLDRVHVRIEIQPATTSSAYKQAKVASWRMRGYVISPPVQEWIVPLVVRSNVIMGSGEGQEVAGDVWTQVNAIRDLWRNGDVIEYVEGDHAELVRIDNFEITAERWGRDSSWFEVNCTVRLLSV